jgi:hypothetical protein
LEAAVAVAADLHPSDSDIATTSPTLSANR